jgi:CubicO group peptidase (beta-lactamase class C family)
VLFLCAISQSDAQMTADSLAKALDAIKNTYKMVGMSVTVVKAGTIRCTFSVGKADITRNVPITDSTKYRIASISKTITATALMQLYEQGKFKLDEDVSRYLGFALRNPDFPSDSITFRMLLSHTSSVNDGDGYNNKFLAATSSNPAPPISDVLLPTGATYTSDMWLSRKPGSYFTYANIGFGILGTLVERLSGERFDLYCTNHIFKPLGLDASYNVQDLRNINNLAVLYRGTTPQCDNYGGVKPASRDLSGYVIGSNAVVFSPTGGVRISSKDLAKIMMARMNGGIVDGVRILNDSTARFMLQPVWTYSGSNGDTYSGLFRKWGLGTQITTNAPMGDIVVPGKIMAGHAGEAYGLVSDVFFEINNEFGIVFITNGRSGSYGQAAASAFYDVEEAVFNAAYAYIKSQSAAGTMRDAGSLPGEIELDQNYPNPFNPSTAIRWSIPARSNVRMEIFSSLGDHMVTLVDGEYGAGTYESRWLADTASGVYFYQLHVTPLEGDGVSSLHTRRLTVLK